jgi:hypothetical protein
MLPVAVAALLAVGSWIAPPAPATVPVVPEEADAFVLPEAPTIQAIAVDLDGDGAQEIVRLVRGGGTEVAAEAWAEDAAGWSLVGRVVVIPASPPGGQPVVAYAGSPVRLIVRHIGPEQRVTVIRQPSYRELDLQPACCLIVADFRLEPSAQLVPVAAPASAVDAVFAVDLDGDGIDELLTTRSLAPLGDISYPTEASLYRWSGAAFSPPVVTELPIGSGDTPFVLGDTDGRPGQELALVSSVGTRTLHRIALRDGDRLETENSGLAASQVLAVPAGDAGVGLAILAPGGALTVRSWPADGPVSEPLGAASRPGSTLVGIVGGTDGSLLLTRATRDDSALVALGLPRLDRAGTPLDPSPAAMRTLAGPVRPYVGPMPHGAPGDAAELGFAGWLVQSDRGRPEASSMPVLAGATPFGRVGRGDRWLALALGASGGPVTAAAGGRLDAPVSPAGSGVSLVAASTFASATERDGGALAPDLSPGTVVDAAGDVVTDESGFVALVRAPAGSRAYLVGTGPRFAAAASVVSAGGRLDLRIVPASDETEAGVPIALTVVTPAGRTYAAGWRVRVLRDAPPLIARVTTHLGSPWVEVSGETAPYAEVRVAGSLAEVDASGHFRVDVPASPWPTDIAVVATDPVGHETTTTVSGIAFLDYRGLPWVAIVFSLVGAAGALLYLRVPRSRVQARPATDDAVLEELDLD